MLIKLGLTLYQMTIFLDWQNSKAFADNKLTNLKAVFLLGWLENIVGKDKMQVTSIVSFSHSVVKGLRF